MNAIVHIITIGSTVALAVQPFSTVCVGGGTKTHPNEWQRKQSANEKAKKELYNDKREMRLFHAYAIYLKSIFGINACTRSDTRYHNNVIIENRLLMSRAKKKSKII